MPETIKAVWMPFMIYGNILTNKSKESFIASIDRYFEAAAAQGLNRIYVHVRPFGDALYRSDYFPASFLISGREGDGIRFDPLEVMTREARKRNLAIEPWINPFRVRSVSFDAGAISPNNPVVSCLEQGDAIEYHGNIVYNPASQRARELILHGVSELCQRYDIDGIHFDDYFYLTQDPCFDMDSYAAYKESGGELSQTRWRRDNVSTLLKQCRTQVHVENERLVFGVSPKGEIERNLNEEFLDVPDILSRKGYVDYICPQAYFAPNDEAYSFDDCIRSFNSLIRADIPLIAGLPAYRIGQPDPHAGAGENDWLEGQHLLADMVQSASRYDHYAGYSLFDFSSVFLPNPQLRDRMGKERQALSF